MVYAICIDSHVMLPLVGTRCTHPPTRPTCSQLAVRSQSPGRPGVPGRTTATARRRSMRASCSSTWPTVPLAALRITQSPGCSAPWASSSLRAPEGGTKFPWH